MLSRSRMGGVTPPLLLLYHMEGDALNVALLVPEVRRATRTGLVGALTEDYGSPGRLADYRPGRKERIRPFSQWRRKHWPPKPSETWATLHDSA